MDMTAITYPYVTLNEFSAEQIKTILEDVSDNLFNPDPYLQQGGDMVRVGGLTYACEPNAASGNRISDLRLGGMPLSASTKYRVAGWAPVGDHAGGEPIWEVIAQYLRHAKTVIPQALNLPKLIGVSGNPGIA
jgi:sulfur-oxidizing protein SoxB